MLYALEDLDSSQRILATPQTDGWCPACSEKVIPKCGEIVTWHWSHLAHNDCDPWSEEGEWHMGWKSLFPAGWAEKVMENHRADICLPGGQILEFQHSPLSPAKIYEREKFYGTNLTWIFDMRESRERFNFTTRQYGLSFRWLFPRKSLWGAKRRMYFDFGDWLLKIGRIYHETPCGGWGRPITKSELVAELGGDHSDLPAAAGIGDYLSVEKDRVYVDTAEGTRCPYIPGRVHAYGNCVDSQGSIRSDFYPYGVRT